MLLSGQQHCLVEAGGRFGGRERVKEREEVVKGVGVIEEVEERQVRQTLTDSGQTLYFKTPGAYRQCMCVFLSFRLVECFCLSVSSSCFCTRWVSLTVNSSF